MKKTGRILAACLALCLMLSMAACGSGSDSTLTSAQAGLYYETAADGSKSVVTLYGSAADSYSVDKNGNIVDSNNKIYIKAENAVEFSRITALAADTGDIATFELWFNVIVPATEDRAATVEPIETKFTMNVSITPFDATCQVLTATIDDPSVIAFDETNNNIPSYGSIATDEYGRQTIVVSSNGTGTVQLGLVASKEGSTNIRVATLDGTVSFWVSANVVLNAPGATSPTGGDIQIGGSDSTTTVNDDGSTSTTTTNADGSTTTTTVDTEGNTTTTVNNAVVSDEEAGLTAYDETVVMYVLGTNGVNVRFGPGTGYDKVGAIGSGEAVTALGVANTGWIKIRYGNMVGYMSQNYLSTTAPVITNTTNTNVVITTTTTTNTEPVYYEVEETPTIEIGGQSSQDGATVTIG